VFSSSPAFLVLTDACDLVSQNKSIDKIAGIAPQAMYHTRGEDGIYIFLKKLAYLIIKRTDCLTDRHTQNIRIIDKLSFEVTQCSRQFILFLVVFF
jgi:hypothetical protein